jgi:hypothetical protein
MMTGPRTLLALCFGALVLAAPHQAHAKKKRARPPAPPVAFYLASDGTKAPTPEAAIAGCQARQSKELAQHPELRAFADPKACDYVITVRGPYVRTRDRGGYDDRSVFVYKGSNGLWYDATGESPCFAAGTPVATPDGDKPIETIEAGDVVYAYDVAAGRLVPEPVERTKRRSNKRVATLTFSSGASVDVTSNHPFFSAGVGRWVEAGRLATGDRVLELHGDHLEEAVLVRKTAFDRAVEVYDLTIPKHHDYFAAGVLVHNY